MYIKKKKQHTEEGKGLKKELESLQTSIAGEMGKQGLRVVRVMQHASGPHDVVHTQKKRACTFNCKSLLECAKPYYGKELTQDVLNEIVAKVKQPDPDAPDVFQLSVKKIKVSQKD